MRREVRVASKFKKDLKKLSKKDILDTNVIVDKLQNDEPLDVRCRDHGLHGNYEGYRECHVHPDLLLVYSKGSEGELLILTLYRLSSHTNIFDVSKGQK